MSSKIFVGNLPFSVEDEKLKELFAPFGEIEEAQIVKNKFSGRSKGFGFVTFAGDSAEESSKKAIAEMNEKDVEGRAISVSEAKPFDPDKPRKSFNGNRSGGRGFNSNRGRNNFRSDRRDSRDNRDSQEDF